MHQRKMKGFSLIELLIVIAIIGILGSVAVPSYTSYVIDSRRLDGQVGLRNAAQIMERCRTQNFTYIGCDADAPKSSPDDYYTIAYEDIADITATTYTLTATPVAGTSQADDELCTKLILDQTGLIDAKPDATDPDECW